MNVLSFKGPFLFMIIISYSALLSQSATEITKDNCKKNRTFLSECSFNIYFQPPLMEKLECFLTFPTKTNNSVRFSSESFVLQRQVGQMCPHFNFDIMTQEKRSKKLFSSCGGTVNPVSATFINFTWGHILYNNEGLIDNSSTIKMQLRLEADKPCDDLNLKTFNVENDRSWIIILSAIGCFVLIIVCVVIVYRYCFKGNERKAPNPTLTEADIPLSESVENGNCKDGDLEDDSKSQDSSINGAKDSSESIIIA